MEIPIGIHKDENSVYGVVVPDVPGCFSWGDSIEGALINAREAICSHIEAMIDEGIPVAIGQSKMGDLMTNADYAGAIWALVDIDLDRHLIHKPHAQA